MAKKKKLDVSKVIKKPGSLTKAAQSAGMSVSEYATKHKNDKGKTGQRARFYFTLMKMSKKKKKG
jgi:hypothetical protein